MWQGGSRHLGEETRPVKSYDDVYLVANFANIPPLNPVIFDTIQGGAIRSDGMKTLGIHGPSDVNANE